MCGVVEVVVVVEWEIPKIEPTANCLLSKYSPPLNYNPKYLHFFFPLFILAQSLTETPRQAMNTSGSSCLSYPQ